MDKIKVFIKPEGAGGDYYAYSPYLYGCYSSGKTIQETLKNFKQAASIHLKSMVLDKLER